MSPQKSLKRRKTLSAATAAKHIKRAVPAQAVPKGDFRGPGFVLTCGQGEVGQLGLGDEVYEKRRLAAVPNLKDIVNVCAGGMHTVCLSQSGKVFTFGCNDDGALGREGNEMTPGEVNLAGRAVQITAGDSHSAALLEDGRVFVWGSFRDSHGSMGLVSMEVCERKPVQLLAEVRVLKVCSGADHLVLLTVDRHIYTCGCGENAQLLLPAIVNIRKMEFDDVWAGTYCTFAKEKSKGDIYVFGLNNYSQLGRHESQHNIFHPVVSQAFSDKSWVKISAGVNHTIALDSNGKTYALGWKEYGRLGLGKRGAGDTVDSVTSPTLIPTLINRKCVDVTCGTFVSMAVTDDDKAYAWGFGTNGQLSTGQEDDEYAPVEMQGKHLDGKRIVQVSAGGQHTVVLIRGETSP